MAQRVFFHIGAPKTGTTYLQRVMWSNRESLRAAGVLIPGDDYRDRVWATHTVREMRQPHARAAEGWQRILRQVHDFDGDAVISHEFFSSATAEQARRAIDALAPAEVHLVYTARDLTRVLPAVWQERLKYRYTTEFELFEPEPLSAAPGRHWSWRTIDAADALRRWGEGVSRSRVHLVTVPPPPAPRHLLWQRFAQACCIDPGVVDIDIRVSNESMGLVESELLRRVNPRIADEIQGIAEVPVWVRNYLGLDVLAKRKGEPIGLEPATYARTRERALAMVDELRARGYDVVGDLADLVPREDPPAGRLPRDVNDAELLDVSLDVIAHMLSDYRRVTKRRDELRGELRRVRSAGGPVRSGRRLRARALAARCLAAARQTARVRGLGRSRVVRAYGVLRRRGESA